MPKPRCGVRTVLGRPVDRSRRGPNKELTKKNEEGIPFFYFLFCAVRVTASLVT